MELIRSDIKPLWCGSLYLKCPVIIFGLKLPLHFLWKEMSYLSVQTVYQTLGYIRITWAPALLLSKEASPSSRGLWSAGLRPIFIKKPCSWGNHSKNLFRSLGAFISIYLHTMYWTQISLTMYIKGLGKDISLAKLCEQFVINLKGKKFKSYYFD